MKKILKEKANCEKKRDVGAEELSGDTLRYRLEELRNDVMREVSAILDTDQLLERLRGKSAEESQTKPLKHGSAGGARKEADNNSIHGKRFQERESELTNLMRINHIATIYNVFVVTLISLFLSTVVHDVMSTGSYVACMILITIMTDLSLIMVNFYMFLAGGLDKENLGVNLGFHLLSWNFERMPTVLIIWLKMMALVTCLYFGYTSWANIRCKIDAKSILLRDILDKLGLAMLLTYLAVHMSFPAKQVYEEKMPFACSMTVMLEQVRLLMKVYSFFRTNLPRTLQHQPTKDAPYFLPSFNKYLYFLFAPTLIYRDEYPKTKRIRWGYAAARFTEVLCIAFYVAFIAERYMLPKMRDFGKPGVPFTHIIPMIIDNSVPAVVGIVCLFYAILHAWLNGMAEILQFGDRMFYRDWWNTTVYAEYYKTWNIVVYDWLYTFIYKDAGYLFLSNKHLRAILVIAVSALFHEYIMAMGLGFFMPAFIIIYGFGGPLVMQLSSSNQMVGNVWIWFTLCLGSGMMVTFYLAEYYARINCPRTLESDFWNFMIPRMATCQYTYS